MNNRRKFLRFTALTVLAGAFSSLTRLAFARSIKAFEAEKIASVINQLYGTDATTTSDAVKLKAPEIAENGAVVPVTVEYDGNAKHIAVLVKENPQPLAAAFDILPDALPHVSTRIKMGKSSQVVALVQTTDGKILSTAREVKVTIGGCGG